MSTPSPSFSTEDLMVDRSLADIASSFRFLLDLTPVDLSEARVRFLTDGRTPQFSYRELEDEPELAARRLAAIPVDDVTDPSLAPMMRAKRRELDLQLEMLTCRGSSDFLGLSIELFGTVGRHLLTEAEEILDTVDAVPATGPWLDAPEIVRRAEVELDLYRLRAPDLDVKVEMREGTAGLMVSNGDLLVPPDARISAERLPALLHHEIGTHVLTHVNGVHQPLRVLASGLAHHDETQEGLAVLAEHLVGGLTGARLRQLAARVVAVHAMVEGAEFADVHGQLLGRGVPANQAFTATARVFRSGGLTKDAIYLRGLRDLVDHLGSTAGSLDVLWMGKMPLDAVPLIADLHARGLLSEPLVVPRYLEDPVARTRLADIHQVSALAELIEEHAP
jgi:uncharacterized protein (TIGR02421 family)